LIAEAEGDQRFIWQVVGASTDKLVLLAEGETEPSTFKKPEKK
jgi:hypothetical protein